MKKDKYYGYFSGKAVRTLGKFYTPFKDNAACVYEDDEGNEVLITCVDSRGPEEFFDSGFYKWDDTIYVGKDLTYKRQATDADIAGHLDGPVKQEMLDDFRLVIYYKTLLIMAETTEYDYQDYYLDTLY